MDAYAFLSREERLRRYRKLAGSARHFAMNAPTHELRKSYESFAVRWTTIADDLEDEMKRYP